MRMEFRLSSEMPAHEIEITKCYGHKNIRRAATRNKVASDFLAVARIMPSRLTVAA